jgi:hypothetical protein
MIVQTGVSVSGFIVLADEARLREDTRTNELKPVALTGWVGIGTAPADRHRGVARDARHTPPRHHLPPLLSANQPAESVGFEHGEVFHLECR